MGHHRAQCAQHARTWRSRAALRRPHAAPAVPGCRQCSRRRQHHPLEDEGRRMTTSLHELILDAAGTHAEQPALRYQQQTLSYRTLAGDVERCAGAYLELGLERNERVAIFLDKRLETVVAAFGAARAG